MASSCAAEPTTCPGQRCASTTAAALSPGAVIWATGFELDHSFVQLPVFDTDGRLVHQRGVTASPGLYFLGMPWQHTRGSALLGWVKDDAQYIADQVATLASTGTRPAALELAGKPPQP